MIKLKLIPRISSFVALTMYPILFVNGKYLPLSERTIRHEDIHVRQQLEINIPAILILLLFGFGWYSLLGYTTFYAWYVCEWIIRLFMKGNAYRNISFEREAYTNDWDIGYLKGRKLFSWIKYLNK